jgi:hypothetical protein
LHQHSALGALVRQLRAAVILAGMPEYETQLTYRQFPQIHAVSSVANTSREVGIATAIGDDFDGCKKNQPFT